MELDSRRRRREGKLIVLDVDVSLDRPVAAVVNELSSTGSEERERRQVGGLTREQVPFPINRGIVPNALCKVIKAFAISYIGSISLSYESKALPCQLSFALAREEFAEKEGVNSRG